MNGIIKLIMLDHNELTVNIQDYYNNFPSSGGVEKVYYLDHGTMVCMVAGLTHERNV